MKRTRISRTYVKVMTTSSLGAVTFFTAKPSMPVKRKTIYDLFKN